MTETKKSAPQKNDSKVKEERNWAMFCHLAALSVWIGVPFGNIIGPLVIWLIKKDDMPFVDDCGKEAMNFQITMTIYVIIAVILVFVFIGIPLLIALGIAQIALTVIAGIKVSSGETYRYPFTMRFIS